jgi:hypothetical protein
LVENGDEENRRGFPYNSVLSEVGEEQCCGSGFIESGYGPGSNISGLDDQKLKKKIQLKIVLPFLTSSTSKNEIY